HLTFGIRQLQRLNLRRHPATLQPDTASELTIQDTRRSTMFSGSAINDFFGMLAKALGTGSSYTFPPIN
ncbi:hypothetical protein C6575_36805, partial [Nocardia seriolae]